MVRGMPGCEDAKIVRYGYAVEYDYVPARQLHGTLETRHLRGLFFAGQINGTSGYEEAAAQGLVAGVNAALQLQGEPPWLPDRSASYIGVLVDDLVTCDIREPYRMFTSRSEYRLMLRHDNAELRLADTGERFGLISPERAERVRRSRERISEGLALLASRFTEGRPWASVLRRPEESYASVAARFGALEALTLPAHEAEQVQIECKYAGYIVRMQRAVERHRRAERVRIDSGLEFTGLPGLKTEAAQAMARFRPATLGQASRLAGITPADIAVLEVHLRRHASSAGQS